MMKLLEYEVTPYDTDYFRCVSPANYLKMMESAGFIALETYGLEMQQMIEQLQATWMMASAELEVFGQIHEIGPVQLYGEPPEISGPLLTVTVRLLRNRELIAQCRLHNMAVNFKTRKVIPPGEVCRHFGVNCENSGGKSPRLVLPETMEPTDEIHVRYSDCDHNRHLRAIKYTDYVCDAAEFWQGRVPNRAKRLQMEYMRECRAGETLTLYSNRETPGTTYVVGKRQDGSDAFRACLEMEADAI